MIPGILNEGFIYAIMVLGVFITFRVLNFCDMTVDGSFPMGACIFAACILAGIPSWVALFIVFIFGGVACFFTNLIFTKLRIPDILSGILMMTMLYSVNLRIMSNQANVSLLRKATIFTALLDKFPALGAWSIVIFMALFIAVLTFLLDVFFSTDFGKTMGALGSNVQMVISQGVDPKQLRTVGICFGNGLAALSGAMFAMYQGFSDVNCGSGVVVSGLASLMLGEFLIRSPKIELQTLRVILGSVLYRALMYFARRYGSEIGLGPNDLKLITGLLIIICLIISNTNIIGYFKEHLKRPGECNA